VSSASITCDGKEIGSIDKGLVCFVGLEKETTLKTLEEEL